VLPRVAGCPSNQMRRDNETFRAGARDFYGLRLRTGALGMRLIGGELHVLLPGETLTSDAMRVRFPDAISELDALREKVREATTPCFAFFYINDWDSVCVQWRRSGRIGGLKGIGGGGEALRRQYDFDTEFLADAYETITMQYWSADQALLDDWERLGPFQEAPPASGVVDALTTPAQVKQALASRTWRVSGFYNTGGFYFSTPYSRVLGAWNPKDVPASLLRPVVEVVSWPYDGPPNTDAPLEIYLTDSEAEPSQSVIRPVRIVTNPQDLPVGSTGKPFIAEFDLKDFKHGRTVVFRHASGAIRERVIKLNGVR
jgi:hypothetical protein